MYKINCNEIKNKYDLEELVKMFLKPTDYILFNNDTLSNEMEEGKAERNEVSSVTEIRIPSSITDKNEAKRYLFERLSADTQTRPDWGILTGVRPGKLVREYLKKGKDLKEIQTLFKKFYYVSDEKIDLLMELYENQKHILSNCEKKDVGIYIGIPFCPTRCIYCSFTSNQASDEKIEQYLNSLLREIMYVGKRMKETGIYAESIYIGGGTPTTLSVALLEKLLSVVSTHFDLSHLKEYTVEAGRPDTITREKLQIIFDFNVDRISINPQSMKARTLELIGRSHSPEQISDAFCMAKSIGIKHINADLIAGLPEEDPKDFENSLRKIIALEPQNITVHTLAVKRASRLIDLHADYHYHQGEQVRNMLAISKQLMKENGYIPYYMYRQKHMAGNFENIGYAKPKTESIYNIRIMEENQTILALGAGGISKVYFPAENRLERVPNVSNYEIYIERLDEMLSRKEKGIFIPLATEKNGGIR
ncbi:coproporphyrinogen dehydrogenase HemZ [Sinanaerobacter sp. ZZT-01]|uniref:coproporphyrinogen dehydrogenase HemZ n=1 Tax=Sinanaerobacter sp. ZZT-01 TaxID=3111540 RepID=UPI002D77D9D9|nr:coproporphyrinogen dehydrogenase HemZ [Sinanaerobacter sp. ZZT-01]WRR93155.1 coproporphyrinogen dehydrogenase HemZ [Sinanaerobacter sp. ZZT-01]